MPAKLTNLICPNPKCKEEFSKPILLTDFSSKPAATYPACPRCLTQLDVAMETQKAPETIPITEREIPAEEEEALEEVESERLEEPEKLEEAEKLEEPTKLEEPEKAPAKPSESEEEAPPGCPHYVGYLSKRPRGTPIPEECLTCPKMIECTLRR